MTVLWSFATPIDGADVFANASRDLFCGALLGLASFAKPRCQRNPIRERGMSRMTSCRACGCMIAASAATCPRCGAVLNRTSMVPSGLS